MDTYENLTGTLVEFNQNYPFTVTGNLQVSYSGTITNVKPIKRGMTETSPTNQSIKSVTFADGLTFKNLVEEMSSYFSNWTIEFTIGSTYAGELWEDGPIFQITYLGNVIYEVRTKNIEDANNPGTYYNCLYESYPLEGTKELLDYSYKTYEIQDEEDKKYKGSLTFKKTFNSDEFKDGSLVVYSPIGENKIRKTTLTSFSASTNDTYSGPKHVLEDKTKILGKFTYVFPTRLIYSKPPPAAIIHKLYRRNYFIEISYKIPSKGHRLIYAKEDMLGISFYYVNTVWDGKSTPTLVVYFPKNRDPGNIISKTPVDQVYPWISSNLINTRVWDEDSDGFESLCVFPNRSVGRVLHHNPINRWMEQINNSLNYKFTSKDVELIIKELDILQFVDSVIDGTLTFNFKADNLFVKKETHKITYNKDNVSIEDANPILDNMYVSLKTPNVITSIVLFNYLTSGIDSFIYKIIYNRNLAKLFNPENPNDLEDEIFNYPSETNFGEIVLNVANDITFTIRYNANLTNNILVPFYDAEIANQAKINNLLLDYHEIKISNKENINKNTSPIFTFCDCPYVYGNYNISLLNKPQIYDTSDLLLKYTNYPQVSSSNDIAFRYNDVETITRSFIINFSSNNIDWHEATSDQFIQKQTLLMQYSKVKTLNKYGSTISNLFRYYVEYYDVKNFDINCRRPVITYNPENPSDLIDFYFPEDIPDKDQIKIRYTSDSDKQDLISSRAFIDSRQSIRESEYKIKKLEITYSLATKYAPKESLDTDFDREKFHYYNDNYDFLNYKFMNEKSYELVNPDDYYIKYLKYPKDSDLDTRDERTYARVADKYIEGNTMWFKAHPKVYDPLKEYADFIILEEAKNIKNNKEKHLVILRNDLIRNYSDMDIVIVKFATLYNQLVEVEGIRRYIWTPFGQRYNNSLAVHTILNNIITIHLENDTVFGMISVRVEFHTYAIYNADMGDSEADLADIALPEATDTNTPPTYNDEKPNNNSFFNYDDDIANRKPVTSKRGFDNDDLISDMPPSINRDTEPVISSNNDNGNIFNDYMYDENIYNPDIELDTIKNTILMPSSIDRWFTNPSVQVNNDNNSDSIFNYYMYNDTYQEDSNDRLSNMKTIYPVSLSISGSPDTKPINDNDLFNYHLDGEIEPVIETQSNLKYPESVNITVKSTVSISKDSDDSLFNYYVDT